MTTAVAPPGAGVRPYRGTDKLLLGIVLAVVTFWLFAGTAGTVAPQILHDINGGPDPRYLDAVSMNLAVSITALFSGLFIVLMGGIADRFGRVRVALAGIGLGVVGSLLLIFASGSLALPLLLSGRAIQGLSAACIMPSTMALVKTYWEDKGRQRAVSMWSIGSWGGSGLAALFGGAMIRYTSVGWRAIFMASIAVSIVSFLLIRGTPESKVEHVGGRQGFDVVGLLLFVVGTLALMIVLLFGSKLRWISPVTLGLAALGVAAYAVFYFVERGKDAPFVDFKLFRNTTFTGATISNFLLNATIGLLIVSQQVIQLAGKKPDGSPYSAWDAGILTIGYGVVIIAFIRVGEKLLQRFGPRKPMIWGSLIVLVACLMLMATHLLIGQYVILAIIAYCLFGLGLAFYATPSTDAALSNLPAAQAGSGAGIYKMASSLGSAIGAAISLAVFTGFATSGASASVRQIGDVLQFEGRTDNIALRLAAMIAIGLNLVFVLLAILSITLTVPKQRGGGGPKPQSEPDAPVQEQLVPCPVCHGTGVITEARSEALTTAAAATGIPDQRDAGPVPEQRALDDAAARSARSL
jgi:DHA2 family multidrug resistance protein-like MFS transporter